MSGVWEALFQEEKQDWISAISGSVSAIVALALEIPCTLLALASTFLLMSWEYTCQGAQQVSDTLGLQEWWAAEHTFWALIILMEIPVLRRRSKGLGNLFVLQSLEILKCIFVWGSFLFLLNGLQGGVVFGGKLFHPTIFALALTCHAFSTSLKTFVKELGGYEHDGEIKDQKVSNFFQVVIKSVDLEALVMAFIGIYGMPQLDLNGDPKTWFVAAPLLLYASSYNEMLVSLAVFKSINLYIFDIGLQDMIAPPEEKAAEANGEPPQVTEEKKSDEEPAKKAEEEPAKEEEKKDEEKTTEEEKKEEVATKKPNPISVALDACCGLVCKAAGMVTCLVNQVLTMINLVKDKVLSLPWACIISLSTTLGIEVGLTYGSWLLTQDEIVFAYPVINILGKFIVDKLGEKKILEAKGVHMATEALDTTKLAIKYYVYRTYISQPI